MSRTDREDLLRSPRFNEDLVVVKLHSVIQYNYVQKLAAFQEGKFQISSSKKSTHKFENKKPQHQHEVGEKLPPPPRRSRHRLSRAAAAAAVVVGAGTTTTSHDDDDDGDDSKYDHDQKPRPAAANSPCHDPNRSAHSLPGIFQPGSSSVGTGNNIIIIIIIGGMV